MWTKAIASGTLVLLSWGLGACGATEPQDGEAIAESTEIAAHTEIPPDIAPSGPRCGGYLGLRCPRRFVCVDYPYDACDPSRGGRDCIGICVRRTSPHSCDYSDPFRDYVSRDPDACRAMFFTCESGMQPFFNACGCGCERTQGRGERCGRAVCGPGEYCCNRSCSLCVPHGSVCTQQLCD